MAQSVDRAQSTVIISLEDDEGKTHCPSGDRVPTRRLSMVAEEMKEQLSIVYGRRITADDTPVIDTPTVPVHCSLTRAKDNAWGSRWGSDRERGRRWSLLVHRVMREGRDEQWEQRPVKHPEQRIVHRWKVKDIHSWKLWKNDSGLYTLYSNKNSKNSTLTVMSLPPDLNADSGVMEWMMGSGRYSNVSEETERVALSEKVVQQYSSSP